MCNGERVEKIRYKGPDTDDELKILHFQYKSKEEWEWKCKNRKGVTIDNHYYNKGRIDNTFFMHKIMRKKEIDKLFNEGSPL